MNVSFNNRDPVYVQVVQHFKEKIAVGEFKPGKEIPSRRELANKLKINPNTAQRAYKVMEEQQLIYTEGNLPSRVTEDKRILRLMREELILESVNEFIDSCHSINLPLEEVIELIEVNYLKKDEEGE